MLLMPLCAVQLQWQIKDLREDAAAARAAWTQEQQELSEERGSAARQRQAAEKETALAQAALASTQQQLDAERAKVQLCNASELDITRTMHSTNALSCCSSMCASRMQPCLMRLATT